MIEITKANVKFAVCIDNNGYQASLEIGKLYPIIPDESAALHGYIRVRDESGEYYGYAKNRFYPIEIPDELEKVLLNAA